LTCISETVFDLFSCALLDASESERREYGKDRVDDDDVHMHVVISVSNRRLQKEY
jgi:hypothetical protein